MIEYYRVSIPQEWGKNIHEYGKNSTKIFLREKYTKIKKHDTIIWYNFLKMVLIIEITK